MNKIIETSLTIDTIVNPGRRMGLDVSEPHNFPGFQATNNIIKWFNDLKLQFNKKKMKNIIMFLLQVCFLYIIGKSGKFIVVNLFFKRYGL